jgi:Phage integrase family
VVGHQPGRRDAHRGAQPGPSGRGQRGRRATPKTLSSRRTLPLDEGLVGVLKRASARYAQERLALGASHADSGYVAVNEAGEPYTPDTLTRMWLKLAKSAGVRPIRLHDARHSCGTALHLRGVPLAVIAAWLGHADDSITARGFTSTARTTRSRLRAQRWDRSSARVASLWCMKVGDSVKFSLDHWNKNEWDAAMLHACNAVDATGKKRYRKLGVTARFKRTIRDSLDIFGAMAMPGYNLDGLRFPASIKSNMPDKRPDVADVVYEIHRCAHGHGDDLPEGFELMPYEEPVTITRLQAGKIRLSAATVLGLLAVAVFAPENVGQTIPDSYWLRLHQHRFVISAWWGRHDDFREINDPIRSQSPLVTIDFAHLWDDWKPL